MIPYITSYLSKKLKEPLPGKYAHIEAAPYRRIEFNTSELKNAKKSAVLVLFYLKENELFLALIKRPTYNGKHSGQISFPGGKHEKSDKNSVETALREANEEVGIISNDVEVVGKLSNVYIPVSQFLVTPVVGVLNYLPHFKLDNHEVEALIELKVSYLINSELTESKVHLANNTVLKVPSFVFDDKIIWGATALMLNELKHLLADLDIVQLT